MNQTNKNKNEQKKNKKTRKKEEETIQKESKNNEKNVPIGLPTKRRIKCEVCSKEDAEFYCSQCTVYYCQKCEAQVHESDLLKQQIEKSKNQHLQLLKTIQIIINNQINQIIQNNQKTIEKINQDKTKIRKIRKLKAKHQKCELINESKEIINKFKKRKKKEKEIFDPKMNYQNAIHLKNQNQTAWNPSEKSSGIIFGQTKYSTGKHKIKTKIDQFPNINTEPNWINLGVINTENRVNLIKNGDFEGTYFFKTHWNKNLLQSFKKKRENGKWYEEKYPENIKLKENDIFEILLDMDQKTIAFKINENNLGIALENLPKSVYFYASLAWMKGNKKNQITLI
ncbi:spry domain containing socs box protein [Anaeramoeba flamelloides]|uniref:Spry domain containing socs box protein n=1 Tax=Anaeramoeba flamelloides TaxID=1746091 RepID=A0ABQ8XWI3_9EUKA|nr:spry domain containing socs box protein [Anaeramoeba flamelloides]